METTNSILLGLLIGTLIFGVGLMLFDVCVNIYWRVKNWINNR